ncbi:MAG: molecular chaperone TorD family protein [Chloroflexi bacterium]|nr:molecular chaperone TorD family protein [Chloroflexota bacterium]
MAKGRGQAYSALALILSKPQANGAGDLRRALQELGKGPAAPFFYQEFPIHWQGKELKVEYQRLFGGGYAPPYESVYRDGEGQVMGQSTLQVVKEYEAEGLILAPEFRDLPDHIAVELQFMSHLCAQEADAWQRGDASAALGYLRKEKAFLGQHLTKWLPLFGQRVRIANAEPYASLLTATASYVAFDRDQVGALLNALGKISGEEPT